MPPKLTKEQRAARKKMAYNGSPQHQVCGNCGRMTIKEVFQDGVPLSMQMGYEQAWCSVGDFPTKRTATCTEYASKQTA